MKIVYQADHAGLYAGEVEADESPLEPGVYLMPSGCVEVAPPTNIPDGKWPRWNGAAWQFVNRPAPAAVQSDPVAKLAAFLSANPDVAALLQSNDGGANA